MMRFQYGGHARISLGHYEERMDTYTDDYFVQHYINGTLIPELNINRTAEVRCSCGKDEPTIISVEYGDHSIIKVEMPSCCKKVEFKSIVNALPRSLSFEPRTGQQDYRFPGSSVSTVRLEFSNRRLTLFESVDEYHEFTIGEPRFISHIPHIALGPMAPRPTLRPSTRPAMHFPLSRVNKSAVWTSSDLGDDDDDDYLREVLIDTNAGTAGEGDATTGGVGDAASNASSSTTTTTKEENAVLGGIFAVCHDNWSNTLTEEMVNLWQVQYLAGRIPEVYLIVESLAFCAFHQLLPRHVKESAIQCRVRTAKSRAQGATES